MKRRKTAEIAQGYPGFPYHHTTTEDYTMAGERFVLRPLVATNEETGEKVRIPGQWMVHWYHCDVPKVVRGKRRRFFI
jgi:hypothetical protein